MFVRMLVPQSAARKIQEMILEGDLKDGEKIPSQRELSQTLNISRASLREALLTLETLGLLRTEPGRGTFVSRRDPSSSGAMARWRYADSYRLPDVFETRLLIEGRIANLAAKAISPEAIEALVAATDNMEKHWAAGDLLANVEADLEFHSIIAAACPNRMLVDLYNSARDLITETQRRPIPITEPARMSASISEHRRIIAALRAHNAAEAKAQMEDHIRNTARCAGVFL
jgi:GntR family transcriptional repressor for pyruvate dehydrogenase complex